MSDDKLYVALREYARLAAETTAKMEVLKAIPEVRAALLAEIPKEGPPGKNGSNGADGKDGRDGVDGKDGAPGERGANGISTREEMEELVERKVADINVRTFADIYQGVYKPDQLYNRGLITTWGGSLWLSLAPTNKKPGEGPDWRLVVKK